MALTWHYDSSEIDLEALSHLYLIAPLGNKPSSNLKTVFSNSRYQCFVFSGDTLIGAGRALADGLDCSYICDIAVHPEFQGKGLGKQMIEYLVGQSKDHKKIILYANPGAESFYAKLGFKKMNTAMAIFKDSNGAISSGILSEY